MNKIVLVLLLVAVVVCCASAENRFTSENDEANPMSASQNDFASDIFTGRGKSGKGGDGGGKNKMEMMHFGLSYFKMVVSHIMGMIGHALAFKAVALTFISVIIQIIQFVLFLKEKKSSHPQYKVVEGPWKAAPPAEVYNPSYGPPGLAAGSPHSPYRRR